MIRRRQSEIFSLSFLDCICCGFGAIILIFVISIGSRQRAQLDVLLALQRALAEQAAALTRIEAAQIEARRDQQRIVPRLEETRRRQDSLQAMIDQLERSLQQEKRGQQALLVDLDELRKEIAARQRKPDHELVLKEVPPAPVGLPVGSNFLAFVVDTSGSMRDPNFGGLWPVVIRTIETVLDAYPDVQGIQLIDGDGRFILGRRASGTAGWLPDSPQTREAIKRTLRRYDQDTVSNPVPGIYNAMRFLFDKENAGMRMGIFVFGDEFNSPQSADEVIRRLDELNPANEQGARSVTINAVGFPTTIRYQFSMGNTGLRFANLMRTVTYLHGGAFIALQDL
ncbi:MAG: hypothetical protein FJ381_03325 [Verrucomicrobia bacterium]|nr:hypothetical protein [Verrucomicrobiota bacterium]